MWEYIVYWTIVTIGPVSCPDESVKGFGYVPQECHVKHEQTMTDAYKQKFQHKENALNYTKVLLRMTDNVKLDSIPK